MKRMFTLISAIFFCILCIILSIQICEAKTVLYLKECGTVLDVFGSSDNNIYILGNIDNNYKITYIDNNFNTKEISLNIDVNNSTYAYANDTFYFFTKDIDIDNGNPMKYTLIDSYNCTSDIQHKRVVNYADPELYGTFAVDNDGNYYMITNNGIEIYTAKYKYLRTVSTDRKLSNLTNSVDGRTIFCADHNGLTIINDNREYYFNVYADKIFPISDGYFATNNGEIYRFDGGTIYAIYSGFDGVHGSAVIGERIFGSKNGVLTAINNEKEISIDVISGDTYICSLGNICCCITQNGSGADVELFTAEDVNKIESALNSEPDSVDITSNVYSLNRSSGTLSGIAPGSTVAAVKGSIQGSAIVFYDKNGNLKTSGKVGTGMIVENTVNHERFKILIYGELSGEGSINSSDKKLLVNHLLDKEHLDGIYLDAADINGDSEVNLKDYVALDSYTKGTYTINQKR